MIVLYICYLTHHRRSNALILYNHNFSHDLIDELKTNKTNEVIADQCNIEICTFHHKKS